MIIIQHIKLYIITILQLQAIKYYCHRHQVDDAQM